MFVACPSCKSLYPITTDQLEAAGGRVRCSRCQTLFNAVDAVFETPQQALAYEYPLQRDLVQEIDELVGRALGQVDEVDRSPSGSHGEPDFGGEAAGRRQPGQVEQKGDFPRVGIHQEAISDSAATVSGESAEVVLRADADGYAQPIAGEFVSPVVTGEDDLFPMPQGLLLDGDGPPRARTSWGAIAAGLLLCVTLLAQYAWWDRNRLAQITALRPVYDWVCQPLDCSLPLRHDLARVEMIEREVRDHPNVKDALLVSAAFINRADYPQAYPVLQIAFSDISGTLVAVRRFMPEEYLHDKKSVEGMAPGEQTLVMLEVADPGERAVSYQFDFM
jgi:predicted Zn finger-like uncharacterized protein